jgi:hypothetical protein
MKFTVLFFLFVFPAYTAVAQDISFYAVENPEFWEISAHLDGVQTDEVIANLEDGLEAEIFFQFRLYERVRGFFSFFGDRLIIQANPYNRASLDRFNNAYVIKSGDREPCFYNEEEAFLHSFFRLDAFKIEDFNPEEGKEYYLLARIRLNRIRLTGPLNIINLFFNTGTSTEWRELNLVSLQGE